MGRKDPTKVYSTAIMPRVYTARNTGAIHRMAIKSPADSRFRRRYRKRDRAKSSSPTPAHTSRYIQLPLVAPRYTVEPSSWEKVR